METFTKDIRYAVRSLLKRPSFTLIAVVTLALGIGANTAIFSVVNAVLLRPLPYRDAQNIVTIWQNNARAGVPRNDVSPANFLDWKEQSASFESMAGIEPFGFSMIGNGEPERFRAWLVTNDFFKTLATNPYRGRTFTADDYKQGNEKVVVIGYGLWQRRFGGDQTLLGQKLTLNGQPYSVVGVMPPEFQFPADREVWAPRVIREHDRQLRGPTYWNVIARLKPGVSLSQAQDEMNLIAVKTTPDAAGMLAPVKSAIREVNRNQTFSTTATMEELVNDSLKQRRFNLFLLVSFAVLALVLAGIGVYGSINYSTRQRTHEIGLRMALGAQSRDVLRLIVGHGLALSLTGIAIGLAASFALTRLMKGLLFGVSATDPLTFVAISVLLISIGLLASWIPARRAARVDPLKALRYE